MGDSSSMHDKKTKTKNTKFMPPPINIGAGAGCLGMGGIVLLGGALVTAALVSALAVKTRRQRPSSSESDTIKKSRSPSPETRTIHAPNQLEFSNKDRESSKDFSVDSLPLDLQNSSDGVTSMKEMQTKPSQNLTPEENQFSGMDHDEKVESGDVNENIIFSVVGEDQEGSWIHVDPVFESQELDDDYEKVALNCEEQMVMATQTELGFPAPRDDGGEQQKYSVLIDDEHTTEEEKSLVSNEAIEGVPEEGQMSVEVEESITVEASQGQVAHGDDVAEEDEAMEAASVNQVKEEEEDNPPLQFLKPSGQEMHMSETFSNGKHPYSGVACIMNLNDSPKVAVDDETTVREDNPPTQLMNKEEKAQKIAQEIKEQVQLTEAAKVVREDDPPTHLMNKEEKGEETAVKVHVQMTTEDELVEKEEKSKEDVIQHAGLIEAIDDEEDVTVQTEVSSDGSGYSSMQMQEQEQEQEELIPEANQKIVEDETILGEEENDSDHNGIMREHKGSKSATSYRGRSVMEVVKGRKQAREPWNLKLWTWSVLVSIWCICHCYSELPYPELSFVGSFLFILILLGHQNHDKYLVKYD